MPAKLSKEKIIEIRKEIRRGKSRRQLAKEQNISVETICKYGKCINTRPYINEDFKNLIRTEAALGKTNDQISDEYGLRYRTVQRITCKEKKRLSDITIQEQQEIRKLAATGITKKRISELTSISYHFVEEITKDISLSNVTPLNVQEQIKEGYKNGKSTQQISEELNISNNTVRKYASYQGPSNHRFRQYADEPSEFVAEIRKRVSEGTSKFQVANEMGLAYRRVLFFTKDIKLESRALRLSAELIEKIRNEVKKYNSKMEVSRKFNVSPKIVYAHTKDILVSNPHKSGLHGNPLVFLQEIIQNGYAMPSTINSYNNYQKIKKKFPNIRRVEMFRHTIYFIPEKSDLAMRVFFEITNKKKISYQELKQIINVFEANISYKEKKRYIRNCTK